MITSTYQRDEARARQLSGLLTLLFLIIGGLIAYLWVVFRGTIPPEDENTYTVIGQFDFGQGMPAASGAPASAAAPMPSQAEPMVTSPASAPVQAPQAPPNPQPAPAADPSETETEDEAEAFLQGQGQGDASSEGDLGAGMFEFGDGEEGLRNRRLLHYVLPRYNVQKEGRIKYELYILPDGTVSSVKALSMGAAPELKRAGEEAIRQWRFNPIFSNEIQRVTVTIRFRLR
jgi:TonB family protein